MKIKILTVLILSIGMFLTSCEEEETTTNEAKVALGFKAVQSVNNLKATDTLVFDTAMIGIQEIEIENEEEAKMEDDSIENENEIEYEFEGPYQVDLLAGTKISELVNIEPGVYTELEAEIAPVLDSNYSVFIKAQYTNANNETFQVIYHTTESIEFEVENEQGIQVSDQEIKDLIIRIDLQSLFATVDLDAANVTGSNKIIINEEQNSEMAEQIKNYLEEASEFEEDDDDDSDDDSDDEDDS